MDPLRVAQIVNVVLGIGPRLGRAGRMLTARLAPYLGRLLLTVEGQPNKDFLGETPPYEMIQAWVSNQWARNAEDVRCVMRWRRQGRAIAERETPAAWCPAHASDMASFASAPVETMTLVSNGEVEHLAVLVKYPGDRNAYIPTRSNYLSGVVPRWKNEAFALQPGGYDVELMFAARGQKTGVVVMSVWNDGENGTIRCDYVPQSTV